MQVGKPLLGERRELDTAHAAAEMNIGIDHRQVVAFLLQHRRCRLGAVAFDHVHLALFEQQRHHLALEVVVFHDQCRRFGFHGDVPTIAQPAVACGRLNRHGASGPIGKDTGLGWGNTPTPARRTLWSGG
jgi:hypothetical protein